MLGSGKDGHVHPKLGDEHFGGTLIHAGDGVEAGEFVGEGGHGDVDLAADGGDGLIKVIEVGQELTDEEGVVGAEAAGERLTQRGQLPPQLAAGEVSEEGGVRRARDQGVEHRAPGGAEQAAGDRGQLDAGVFEDFVQAVGVARALLNEDLTVAREVAELADRDGWHEAGADEPMLEQLSDPGAVLDIGLAPGHGRSGRRWRGYR